MGRLALLGRVATHGAQRAVRPQSASGALLDATPFEGGAAPAPALASDTASWPYIESAPGNGAVISWMTGGHITVQALRADGTAAAAPHIVSHLADTWRTPSVASDGTSFVVGCTQTDPLSRAANEARFFVVRPDGSNVAGGSYTGTSPLALVWDGASYRGLRAGAATSVSAAGVPSTPTTFTPPSGYGFRGSAVVLGGITYAALYGTVGGVVRVDASGRQIDPYPIAAGDSNGSVLATDGTVVMAQWQSSSVRISAAGDVLDATPWNWLFPAGGSSYYSASGIAYGGGMWAVAITTGAGPVAWLLQKASATDPVRVTTLQSCEAVYGVTWNGREFVVVGGGPSQAAIQAPLSVWSVAAGSSGGTVPALTLDGSRFSLTGLDAVRPKIASTRDGTTAVVFTRFDSTNNTYRCAVRLLAPDGDAGTADAAVDATVDATVSDVITDTGARDVATDTAVIDTGVRDVVTDTGAIDTGIIDAGVVDTGVRDVAIDTGATDAGAIDTGVRDVVTDVGVVDTGVIDTGVRDVVTDVGVVDTGVIDAGVRDVVTDVGVVDTGVIDTGVRDVVTDVGVVDTGVIDTGVRDVVTDVGVVDTGVIDAGVRDVATDTIVDTGVRDVVTDTGLLDTGPADSGVRDAATDTSADAVVSDVGARDVATDTSTDVTLDGEARDAMASDAIDGDADVFVTDASDADDADGEDAPSDALSDAGRPDVSAADSATDADARDATTDADARDASDTDGGITPPPPANDGCSTQCGVGLRTERSDGKGAMALGIALIFARRPRRKRG